MKEMEDDKEIDEVDRQIRAFWVSETRRHMANEKAFWKPKNRPPSPSSSSSSSDEDWALPPLRQKAAAAVRTKTRSRPPSSTSLSASDEDAPPPIHFRSTIRRKRARMLREKEENRGLDEAYLLALSTGFKDKTGLWKNRINEAVEKDFQSWVVKAEKSARICTVSSGTAESPFPVNSSSLDQRFLLSPPPRGGRVPRLQVQQRRIYTMGPLAMILLWKRYRLSGGRGELFDSIVMVYTDDLILSM